MKIKVLGCSGAEFPGHNPPGFLLEDKILFDAGSLTNVLSEREQRKIKDIFITHAHFDHIRGIPFLADNIIIGGNKGRIRVMTIPAVLKTLKTNLFNSSMWPDFTVIPTPLNAVVTMVAVKEGKELKIDGYRVTPFTVNHSVPATGYLVEDGTGRRFFYTGDTGPTDETWKKIGDKKIHCLIIEVSFPDSMTKMALATGHLTCRLLKKELPKLHSMPEKIYITHPKPQFLPVIRREIARLRMKNLRMLRDGDTITV
jgi:ribonuclease BN (tRNA processing enzyme)